MATDRLSVEEIVSMHRARWRHQHREADREFWTNLMLHASVEYQSGNRENARRFAVVARFEAHSDDECAWSKACEELCS